jgi:hypothetical protein
MISQQAVDPSRNLTDDGRRSRTERLPFRGPESDIQASCLTIDVAEIRSGKLQQFLSLFSTQIGKSTDTVEISERKISIALLGYQNFQAKVRAKG